ncbi:centrosomal protein kizuna isoform X2 [Hyla sarda]|uniref:centrosomal protein kizuna isoform X2 n=1 Tax=Hyla sarda TaxID=327740 RepID=UPI0024C3945B|nr:centrosomal protein kizuna isoform X2 [Hyla sarda]
MEDGVRAGADYEQQVTKLRKSLRDCELKRLELERRMSKYSSSSTHLCHRQYEKLKNSLREICEKEKKARLRNQTFLQEFESIEARLRFLLTNSRISQHTKMLQVSRQAEINTSADMSRRIYHPATIFMGRQMSANSSIEHCLTQRKSPQPTKSFSISDPHSVRQAAINSNVTDSCVVPANSDTQCLNKPDKIDGETSSFQISQKMLVTSIASSEDARTHRAEIDKTQSGRKHLVESRQSAQLSSQTLKRLSPENRTGDLQNDSPGNKVEDSLMYERLVPNEERFTHASPSGSPPDACDYINNQTSDNRSAAENLSDFHHVPNKEDSDVSDSSSDLTVSITESDVSVDDLLNAIDEKKDSVGPQFQNKPEQKTPVSNKKIPDNKFPSSSDHYSYEESSSLSTVSPNNLSSQGFIHLLQCIEGMLQQMEPSPMQLYQDTGLSHKKRDDLIRVCNQMKPLNKEDLEACTALVTQQLQIDSGRIVDKEIICNHNLNQDGERIHHSTVLSRPVCPDTIGGEMKFSASLREHLLGHIAFLKERGILKGGVPAGFATVLMLHDEMKSQQGSVNTTGDLNSTTSISSTDEQSSNLLKRDQTVNGHYNHKRKHEDCKVKNRDDTSSCEDDSRDGKFGAKERVPGNSTVLLQDVRDRVHTEEDNIEEFSDISDIEIPGLTQDTANLKGISRNKQSSEGTISSNEPSPVHRKENASTVATKRMFNKGPNKVKSKGMVDSSHSTVKSHISLFKSKK